MLNVSRIWLCPTRFLRAQDEALFRPFFGRNAYHEASAVRGKAHICIKLPHKAAEVAVFEVTREELVCKIPLLPDNKAASNMTLVRLKNVNAWLQSSSMLYSQD